MRSVNARVGRAPPWATVGEWLVDGRGGGRRQTTANAGSGDTPTAARYVTRPPTTTAHAAAAANASGGDAPTAARSAAPPPTRTTPAAGTRPQQADYHSFVKTNLEQDVNTCQSSPSVTSFPKMSTFFLLFKLGLTR